MSKVYKEAHRVSVMFCLSLNKNLKDNLSHPTPVTSSLAEVQLFSVSLMTCTEPSVQKGTELIKHSSLLLLFC